MKEQFFILHRERYFFPLHDCNRNEAEIIFKFWKCEMSQTCELWCGLYGTTSHQYTFELTVRNDKLYIPIN